MIGKTTTTFVGKKATDPAPTKFSAVAPVKLTDSGSIKYISHYKFPTAPNNGHIRDYTFPAGSGPQIIALKTTDRLVKGTIYRINLVRFQSTTILRFLTLSNNQRFLSLNKRGDEFEVFSEPKPVK